jgi:shikimate dehydrogenase
MAGHEDTIDRPAGITAQTALVGLLGDPVHHSLSPVMQNAALQSMGLDWVFVALPTPANDLEAVLRGLRAVGCRGLNVTIPHKHSVVPFCTELSPLAQRLGAVNTLVPTANGGWFGTNTDVEGFIAPLRNALSDWRDRRALVLGCGGSARAIVAGIMELGCKQIQLAGRRPEALAAFQQDCRTWAPRLGTLDWRDQRALCEALAAADLVVNTTPLGMASPDHANAVLASPLPADTIKRLQPESWVYDIIYTPRPTRFLSEAAAHGCRTIDGLEMLVQQGAAALRLWSQRSDVPVTVMRHAAQAGLADRC